jgi:hypothetical protein
MSSDKQLNYEETVVVQNTVELSQEMLDLVFQHVQTQGSNDPHLTPMVAASFASAIAVLSALIPGFRETFDKMMGTIPKM